MVAVAMAPLLQRRLQRLHRLQRQFCRGARCTVV